MNKSSYKCYMLKRAIMLKVAKGYCVVVYLCSDPQPYQHLVWSIWVLKIWILSFCWGLAQWVTKVGLGATFRDIHQTSIYINIFFICFTLAKHKPNTINPLDPNVILTCDRGGTLTTTVGRSGHSLWWKLCLCNLPLYPQCTSWRRLRSRDNQSNVRFSDNSDSSPSWTVSTSASYPSSRRGHSSRSSSPRRCCRLEPRADVYRWRSDASHSWMLYRWRQF